MNTVENKMEANTLLEKNWDWNMKTAMQGWGLGSGYDMEPVIMKNHMERTWSMTWKLGWILRKSKISA